MNATSIHVDVLECPPPPCFFESMFASIKVTFISKQKYAFSPPLIRDTIYREYSLKDDEIVRKRIYTSSSS